MLMKYFPRTPPAAALAYSTVPKQPPISCGRLPSYTHTPMRDL